MRAKTAFAALALLLAAGCTGSGGDGHSSPPPTSPPITSSAPTSTVPTSPSTTPPPTVPSDVPTTGPNLLRKDERPPVEPVAATKHTAAGAKSFAEFFVRTMDWGYATVSGTYMRKYSSPNCNSCNSVANGMDADRRAEHSYIGGRSRIVATRPGSAGALRSQVVTVNSTSFEEVDRHGKFVTGDQAYRHLRYNLTLAWQSTHWIVTEFTVSP